VLHQRCARQTPQHSSLLYNHSFTQGPKASAHSYAIR